MSQESVHGKASRCPVKIFPEKTVMYVGFPIESHIKLAIGSTIPKWVYDIAVLIQFDIIPIGGQISFRIPIKIQPFHVYILIYIHNNSYNIYDIYIYNIYI